MAKFNHAVSLSFSIVSETSDGCDFTPAALKAAILQRIADLDNSPAGEEWIEAVGMPDDTYHVESEYLFEVRLNASIRVKAKTEVEAVSMLEKIDANTANLGAWPNGDPIICEVSIFENAAGGSLKAVEIDGQEV